MAANTGIFKGIVKQVLTGDSIVVRNVKDERTIALSNLTAPRLHRRVGNPPQETPDEPYAWHAREFLRKQLIGREVLFTIEFKAPQGREYGTIFLPSALNGNSKGLVIPGSTQELFEVATQPGSQFENINESIVAAGWVEVRKLTNAGAVTSAGNSYARLIQLEEVSKSMKKGKWNTDDASELSVRNVISQLEDPIKFVESKKRHGLPAIIEHVRDGSSMRVTLLPDKSANQNNNVYYSFMLMFSGLRTPTFKQAQPGEDPVAEEFADEAKKYVEARLLQREVTVHLESVSGQSLVGSVLHPRGNIAHHLLQEGLAKCVDWSMAVVSTPGGPEKMREAERMAKNRRLRIWKDYQPSENINFAERFALNVDKPMGMNVMAQNNAAMLLQNAANNGDQQANATNQARNAIIGKVIEVGNGDSLLVKCSHDQELRKFFLASIRPPRLVANAQPEENNNSKKPGQPQQRVRPLYDVPYLFEAREFLRKKLIGKEVTVLVDYIQPPMQTGQGERVCATIMLGHSGDVNIGEALVSKGLATVVKYRPDDEKRSRAYDQLLAAEAVAQKKAVNLHSSKSAPTHRVAELQGDVNKSRQFLPFLTRGGRLEGIVEFVASGSRLRVYIPKETCLITLLCGGIECPKPARKLPNGKEEPADPFGEEALKFTRELINQREVEVEIEASDKGGNFVGWLFVNGSNLSVTLVEHGLAEMHFTAERSNYFSALNHAQEKAISSKLNLWKDGSGTSALKQSQNAANASHEMLESSKGLSRSYKAIFTALKDEGLRFYVNPMESADRLDKVSTELMQHIAANPPSSSIYTPKTGDYCAAKFSFDNAWYRAKITKLIQAPVKGDPPVGAKVLFIDYGNVEIIKPLTNRLTLLPPSLAVQRISAQAKEHRLGGVDLPKDLDEQRNARAAFEDYVFNRPLLVRPMYEDAVSVHLIDANYSDLPIDKLESMYLTSSKSVDDNGANEGNKAFTDVAFGLLQEGLVCVDKAHAKFDVRLHKRYNDAQTEAIRKRLNVWRFGDFTGDEL